VQVDADSKEAKRAAQKSAAASTGLDAFLQQIESKKKVRGTSCWQHGYYLTPVLLICYCVARRKAASPACT
jgi:hypothetical protein